jgi:hypothetical protein
VEIVDAIATTPLISSPVFTGQGNGTLAVSSFSGTAQDFTVDLADLGAVLTTAGTDLDGSKIIARTPGGDGNLIHISVDRSTLVYTDTLYSLITDLPDGTEYIEGPEYDWNTKVMGSDKNIPADAHRVSFGDTDAGLVYTQYKLYTGGKWEYHFEPKIQGTQVKTSKVKFVTGGRTVTVTDGTTTETYTGIVTLYDFLSALKTGSALLDVEGVVANDRRAGGMAAHDLTTRTDAHFTTSTGSGGSATGFIGVSVSSGAPTELIEARCWANTASQSPNSGIGREIWALKGSVSGDLGNIVTGVPFTSVDLSLTIPSKLPDGFGGAPKGRFSVTDVSYATRTGDPLPVPPELCVGSLALGSNAVDQTVTLVYTAAPDPACACSLISSPDLSGSYCLTGLEGGISTMAYSVANVARLTALYDWMADTFRSKSAYLPAIATAAFLKEARTIVSQFETVLARVNNVTAGETNWDTALIEFQGDITSYMSSSTVFTDGVTQITGNADVVAGATASDLLPAGTLISVKATSDSVQYGPGPTSTAGRFGLFPRARAEMAAISGQDYTDRLFPLNAIVTASAILASDPTYGTGMSFSYTLIAQDILEGRYETRLNWVLMSAGVSPLGKSDASADLGGDGCWEDKKTPFYWKVTGSTGGEYKPAFTGVPYFSSRENVAGSVNSTREFAFQINIACAGAVLAGDTITLSIGASSSQPSTYQVGDTLYLPVIAASDLYLAGGNDGDNIQTWHVAGSVAGAMAAYSYDPGTPTPYSSGGLGFTLTPGPIPFTVGDKFTFTVEGGHYKWRKNSGAWSASAPIPSTPVAIDSGLSLQFYTSAAPSFVAGDTFPFTALQPYAVSNCQKPGPERWQWSGSSASLVVDLGSVVQLTALALAYHTLPIGSVVSVDGGTAPGVYTWNEPLSYQADVMSSIPTGRSARYIRLNISAATGGAIGWFWAGDALSTEYSAEVKQRRAYKLDRGAGLNPSSVFHGAARSGDLNWTEGSLSDADVTLLFEMLDYCKLNDDEPVIIYPQYTRPTESILATLLSDDVELPEVWDYAPNAGVARRFSLKLPFTGVFQ